MNDPGGLRKVPGCLLGDTRRAIDIHEGAEVDVIAFKAIVSAAVALNAKKAKA